VRVASRGNRGVAIVGVVFLAIVAAALAAFATREGPGLTPDSRGYLLVAEQLQLGHGLKMLDGDGKKVPLTHAPPLFPLMLWSGDALLAGDRHAAARAINVALFALNVLLAGMMAWRASNRSAVAAILAAGLAAVGLDLVLVHSMVWTEPTFLFCTFASVYCLGRYLDDGRVGPLAVAAVFAGLAFATRYAGAALMLASGLLVLFAAPRSKNFVRRIADAFVYSLLSAGVMFVWLARNAMTTRDADGHAFAIHLPNRSDVKNALVTVAGWVVPMGDTSSTWVVVATMAFGMLVGLGVLVLLVTAWRNGRRAVARDSEHDDARDDDARSLASASRDAAPVGAGLRRAIAWFLPIYLGFILVSISFFDAHVPLDRRILSPVHVGLIVLVVAAIAAGALSPGARRAGVFVIALIVAGQGLRAAQWAAGAPQSRQLGYANRDWQRSPTMAAAAALPHDGLDIFTNGVDAMYLRINRFARPLPKVTDPTKAAKDSKFRKYMNDLKKHYAANGGYVVYFRNIPRAYVVSEKELLEIMPMELIENFPDGAIYRHPKRAATQPATTATTAAAPQPAPPTPPTPSTPPTP
jgi:hypothetical protein